MPPVKIAVESKG